MGVAGLFAFLRRRCAYRGHEARHVLVAGGHVPLLSALEGAGMADGPAWGGEGPKGSLEHEYKPLGGRLARPPFASPSGIPRLWSSAHNSPTSYMKERLSAIIST